MFLMSEVPLQKNGSGTHPLADTSRNGAARPAKFRGMSVGLDGPASGLAVPPQEWGARVRTKGLAAGRKGPPQDCIATLP